MKKFMKTCNLFARWSWYVPTIQVLKDSAENNIPLTICYLGIRWDGLNSSYFLDRMVQYICLAWEMFLFFLHVSKRKRWIGLVHHFLKEQANPDLRRIFTVSTILSHMSLNQHPEKMGITQPYLSEPLNQTHTKLHLMFLQCFYPMCFRSCQLSCQ